MQKFIIFVYTYLRTMRLLLRTPWQASNTITCQIQSTEDVVQLGQEVGATLEYDTLMVTRSIYMSSELKGLKRTAPRFLSRLLHKLLKVENVAYFKHLVLISKLDVTYTQFHCKFLKRYATYRMDLSKRYKSFYDWKEYEHVLIKQYCFHASSVKHLSKCTCEVKLPSVVSEIPADIQINVQMYRHGRQQVYMWGATSIITTHLYPHQLVVEQSTDNCEAYIYKNIHQYLYISQP